MAEQLLAALPELYRRVRKIRDQYTNSKDFEVVNFSSEPEDKLHDLRVVVDPRLSTKSSGQYHNILIVTGILRDHWLAPRLSWSPDSSGRFKNSNVTIGIPALEVDETNNLRSTPEGWVNLPYDVAQRMLQKHGYELRMEDSEERDNERQAVITKDGKPVGRIVYNVVKLITGSEYKDGIKSPRIMTSNNLFPKIIEVHRQHVKRIINALFRAPPLSQQLQPATPEPRLLQLPAGRKSLQLPVKPKPKQLPRPRT